MGDVLGASHLSYNLRRLRQDRRWSQTDLAERAGAGFTQQYISNLERGLQPRTQEDIRVLARELGVPESALLKRRRQAVAPKECTATHLQSSGCP
jgi:transcriptional regulator with XRE-family HTH domain